MIFPTYLVLFVLLLSFTNSIVSAFSISTRIPNRAGFIRPLTRIAMSDSPHHKDSSALNAMPASVADTTSGSFKFVGESAKVFVSGLAGLTVLLQAKSWRPLYYIFMAVANAILSKALKRAIKQPRPAGSTEGGYGMPSSHTQSLFYFFSIIASLTLEGGERNSVARALLVAAVGGYAFLASAWRVSGGLHTVAQTLVGGVIGLSVGQLSARLEPYILFRPAHFGLLGGLTITQRLTAGPVPLAFRLLVISIGALVLYKREIFDLEKRWHKAKAS